MQELDYDYNLHTDKEADRNLAVRFYLSPMQDQIKTAKEGRPIFVDTEFIEIRGRGDRTSVVQRPVREDDKKRFREAYQDFKAGREREQGVTGTPLKEWPIASASMVEELKYLGFVTVEHVADASDSVCMQVPGLTLLKQKAKAFIDLAKGAAPIEELTRQLEEERSRREAAERQMAAMNARLEALEDAKPQKVAAKAAS